MPPRQCPDLDAALLNLNTAMQLLTQFSMDSMLGLLPESAQKDEVLLQHYRDLVTICGPLQLGNENLNPKWNKSYGVGTKGTYWDGPQPDGYDRGGIPYYCPDGWVRFSLNVCEDKDFMKKYNGWGYLYHGTKGKYMGSILTSGLRGSQGLCYCGENESAVFFSPSIEYCSHPRYASVSFNPETRKYIQLVLQCRVNPKVIWQMKPETMACDEFDIYPDDNICSSQMEILVKPNSTCPKTGHRFIKDGVVCTGVMMRVTDRHPLELDYWWAQNPEYARHWNLLEEKVNPQQFPQNAKYRDKYWKKPSHVEIDHFVSIGKPCESNFRHLKTKTVMYKNTRLSPQPFANGTMRFCYYLHTKDGLYVIKKYNRECEDYIWDKLNISVDEAAERDILTYLAAKNYAHLFNMDNRKVQGAKYQSNQDIDFLDPLLVRVDGEVYFGEKFVSGKFIKWNDNTGHCNVTAEGKAEHMDEYAGGFSHFTYAVSDGKLAIVDIQGWDIGTKIVFTDPQIHTGCKKLKDRFSIGNHGKTGIVKFFASHECTTVDPVTKERYNLHCCNLKRIVV